MNDIEILYVSGKKFLTLPKKPYQIAKTAEEFGTLIVKDLLLPEGVGLSINDETWRIFNSDQTVVINLIFQQRFYRLPNGFLIKDGECLGCDNLKRMFGAIQWDGVTNLLYASSNLQQDSKFALEAIRQCSEDVNLWRQGLSGRIWLFIADCLKQDPNFVLKAMQANGNILEFASAAHQADEQLVLAALKQCAIPDDIRCEKNPDGRIWLFIADCLKQDPNFVVKAMQANGSILEFASAAHQADEQLVLAAIKQLSDDSGYHNPLGKIWCWVADNLKNSLEFVIKAMKLYGYMLEFAWDRHKNHVDVVLAAVSDTEEALEFASADCKDNEQVVLFAIKKFAKTRQLDPSPLLIASDRLRRDPTVVAFALTHMSEVNEIIKKSPVSVEEFVAAVLESPASLLQILENEQNLRQEVRKIINALRKQRSAEYCTSCLNKRRVRPKSI